MEYAGKLKVAAIQPPVPNPDEPSAYLAEGKRLSVEAADAGADLICLPEYFGVYGWSSSRWRSLISNGDETLREIRGLAAENAVAVLYPSVELADGKLYNTTYLIGADGALAGFYRKTHLTLDEREMHGLTPGDSLPVFELDGVPVAVMTCYDAYFPEVPRILALKGAKILFWPSLQRGSTEDSILLQARSRALDNAVFVVRSSYGHPKEIPWKTGMPPGASCVIDSEGRVVANAGLDAGFALAAVDWRSERPKPRSFGGDPAKPGDIIREDRRPELYAEIAACSLCEQPRTHSTHKPH